MPVRSDISSVVKLLRADPRYKKLRHLFGTSPLYTIPLDKLSTEISSVHATRLVRRLNAMDSKIVQNIINASIHDQSVRSRLAEILITLIRSKSTLSDALESLRHYYLTSYQIELRQFRTKEERIMILNMVLRTFDSYITNVDVVRASAEIVIADIDKAAWALRATVDAMKIHAARETNV